MPEPYSFEYAIIRVVPLVEREEFVNVGVVLHCQQQDFLAAQIDFDLSRLQQFATHGDLRIVQAQLQAFAAICSASPEADSFARWPRSERFNWLVAPSSTVIQTSPVHGGITADPAETLRQLYELLVR